MIALVVVGAAGRMGRAVAAAASADAGVRVRACVDRDEGAAARSGNSEGANGVWSNDLAAVVTAGDVVIEFSGPDGCREAARLCAERGVPLVSGSTGLSEADEAVVAEAATRTAVLRAANFSLGIAVLREALRTALPALPDWDVEIVERHHRRKADSPSGTALVLARDALDVKGSKEAALRFGRHGRPGPRSEGEIGVHAVRGGGWVGDHQVLIAGEAEWLELRHVAQDRGAFAHGAIAAAKFLAGRPAGFYTLEHVIRGRSSPTS